jgi:hypothetical protein
MSKNFWRLQRERSTVDGGTTIGNVLEWFDFAVYGYFASDFGARFFPESTQPHGREPLGGVVPS